MLWLVDFQREIDELMASQESETKQLEIKKAGLSRLEKSEKEAELALADMRHALDGAEHEVAVLKSRREQAQVESNPLARQWNRVESLRKYQEENRSVRNPDSNDQVEK